MISEAIEYPLAGDDAPRTLAIGGGVYFVSGLVSFVGMLLFVIPLVGLVLGPLALLVAAIPSALLGGYSVAVSRSVMEGRTEPPAFEDWGQYFRDGLYLLAIGVVYSIPAVVVGAVGLVVFLVASLLPDDVAGVVVALLALAGGLVGFVYSLAFGYAYPAALVNYARTGELAAAWDVPTLRRILTHRDYAVAWAVGAVVLLAANSAGSSLVWILVGFVVLFYGQLAGVYLFTTGVMDALDVAPEPPTPPSSAESSRATAAGRVDDEATDDGESDDGESDGARAGGADDGGRGPADGARGPDVGDVEGMDGPEAGPGESDRALGAVDGVGPATAEALRASGYESVGDLRAATRKDLTGVDGIGPAKADRIKGDVDDA